MTVCVHAFVFVLVFVPAGTLLRTYRKKKAFHVLLALSLSLYLSFAEKKENA